MRKIKLLRPIATFGATGIPVMRKVGQVVDMEAKAAVRFVADGGGIDVTAGDGGMKFLATPNGKEVEELTNFVPVPSPPGPLNAPTANSRTSRASGKPDGGKVPSAD